MSDERLQELGLPRREFLKRAAAVGAFAAPVIVSFGFSGTAEAAPYCFPNQTFSNQTHTLFSELTNAAYIVWEGEQESLVQANLARSLRGTFLRAAGDVLDGNPRDFCRTLSQLQSTLTQQSGRGIDPTLASELLSTVNTLFGSYCSCV